MESDEAEEAAWAERQFQLRCFLEKHEGEINKILDPDDDEWFACETSHLLQQEIVNFNRNLQKVGVAQGLN